jgi:tetratricopeptide (TPR) repeat protein
MRSDWAEALSWQQRIAAALPRNPLALRQLGQTLHNHRYAITLPDGRPHWLLRNSLVRAEWEARALQLFDSSAAVTDDPVERARAHYWKGRTAEFEGLPLDALAEYEAALAIVPGDTTLQRVRDLQRQKLVAEP